jgi:hypothetical protein
MISDLAPDFSSDQPGKNGQDRVPLELAGRDEDHFFGMEEGDR